MILHEEPGFRIRHFRADDHADLLAVTSDPVVVRHVGDGRPLQAAQVSLWLDRSFTNYREAGYGSFALADPADDRLFGWGGFVRPGPRPVPEIIYGFAQARWGCGLGRRVAAALTGLGLDRFGFDTILATIDEANHPSRRIVEGLGYRLEKIDEDAEGRVCHYLLDRRHGTPAGQRP